MRPRPLQAALPLAAALALVACSSSSTEQTQADAMASAPVTSHSATASATPSPTASSPAASASAEVSETAAAAPSSSPETVTQTTAAPVSSAAEAPASQPAAPAPTETPVQAINPPVNSGATTLITDLAPYQTSIDGVTPAGDGKVYFQTADGAGCVMSTEQVSCYRAGSQGRIGYGVMWLNPGTVPHQDFLQGSTPGFAPFSFGTQLPANHTITVGEFSCTATPDGAARCDNGVHWFALSNSIKDFSG
ncbi:hypothetical protein [Rothia nasimurium]|uniref:hypothetical protein n=2 Tax=Rothia nasimurium TaxID=85336 RepID=UPI001F354C41|nr:hypothetical protein [Rothia nasimurium]